MTFKILTTTDIHGAIFPTDFTAINQHHEFGLAKVSSYLKELRKNHHVLYLDNGDSFQGTPLCTYAHDHHDTVANPVAQAFNAMKLDYYNLGNHDFNFGKDILFKFINENNATLLTSNVSYQGHPLGKTQIITIDHQKIALIGVVTHYIPNWEQASNIEGFTFLDAYQTLKNEVALVKDQVDCVIAMYHGGFERDLQTGEPTERLTGENQGYQMSQIEGIDILISGHQHRDIIAYLNNILVTQHTLKAQRCIEITVSKPQATAQFVETNQISMDQTLLNPLLPLYNQVQSWLDQPIGQFKDGDLHIADSFQARVHKHPLISFMNYVQQTYTQAQLSAVSLFDNVPGFNQHVTMRDLVSTYIYPNTLMVKKISGKTLREMLEFSAHYFDLDEDGQLIVAKAYREPKPQHYNYDMVDGVTYTIDVRQPLNQRITQLTYQQKPVTDTDEFTIVVNNYRGMGGGNYWMIKESDTLYAGTEEMVDILMDFFQKNSPVSFPHQNNITIIY